MNMDRTRHNNTIHLVLIGYIGSGKSSTANTIVRRQVFKRAPGSIRITTKVQISRAPFPSIEFYVVDTPGLEKDCDFDWIKQDIKNKFQPQRIVYAFVVRIGRALKDEIKLLNSLFMRNRQELFNNAVMIFTNAKELLNDDNIAAKRTFETWIADMPNLKKIIDDNTIQCLLFENVNASDDEKKSDVNKLLMLLNIPLDWASSEQTEQFVDPLCTWPNQVDERNKEETTIRLTKSQLQKQFGQAGLDFFEIEDRKQNHLLK
ncbi:Hypothetical predicted protein [Mytilus galloprovincialis]|uniref:AIG1-type G domain-containing protein n=1 Tax=Mytilus galloprovincialis TaxID=29158 RepID=A0A8B6C4P8_MYTGA|nr:Hypothetical predicted protein [Mytilus galloprovincialis]